MGFFPLPHAVPFGAVARISAMRSVGTVDVDYICMYVCTKVDGLVQWRCRCGSEAGSTWLAPCVHAGEVQHRAVVSDSELGLAGSGA